MSNKKKKGFSNMVAEFGSNWKTITDAAKKREELLKKAQGK